MPGVDRRTVIKGAAVALQLTGSTWTVIAGPVGGGVQPVMAYGDSNVVRPDDGRLTYEGHWGRTADAAITVNSGSLLTFRFTGDTADALFDVSSITVPTQIYVSVDAGPKRLYAVDRGDIARRRYGRLPHPRRRRPARLADPGRLRTAGRDQDRQRRSAGRAGGVRLELRGFQGGPGPPASSRCTRSTVRTPTTSPPSTNSPTDASSSSTPPTGSPRRTGTSTGPSHPAPKATARRPTD
ncbi:hypothetical protein EJ357_40620 [Streptomyces cyaneochromogenes]|uniref:Uncharacterized protein n=1 Tax=Streptomyces cyaneochromogenes TaxID=2496836 RepID=A0A3S9MIG2_9ACTN|nr:hypothetical protein [Streptomyces cyaneochromogenes]AZQ38969.1 hypothetical protein EJ357_40620 [Streptomyces cyaneochromogenes]